MNEFKTRTKQTQKHNKIAETTPKTEMMTIWAVHEHESGGGAPVVLDKIASVVVATMLASFAEESFKLFTVDRFKSLWVSFVDDWFGDINAPHNPIETKTIKMIFILLTI